MPPSIALILWAFCVGVFLYLDPAREKNLSPANWIPVIWLFILSSRLPSQWLGGQELMSAQAMEDGNPLDRVIFLILIALSIGVLTARSFKWGSFFRQNIALTVFVGFELISAIWSDFPFIVFKRWVRDWCSYLIALVVLSDPRPLAAIRTVLRRFSILAIPLSILLDKYFPELGKQYDYWSGVGYYVGITTSKNMLGLLCMISGIYFFWDSASRWHERKGRRTKQILYINAIFFGLTVWLLKTASSTTSTVCLVLGCLMIVFAHIPLMQRNRALFKAIAPALFGMYLVLNLVFGMNGQMAQAVGKDPTLTDRTKIWTVLLSMHTNPLIGVGYQSFWLGSRLESFWNSSGLGHLNEAHNGYLEVYLEMGVVGVLLACIFLFAGYRVVCQRLKSSPHQAVLALAIWTSMVFYNMSEAALEGGLLYIIFLMGALVLPESSSKRVRNTLSMVWRTTEERMSEPVPQPGSMQSVNTLQVSKQA